jgi:hypothetical protein
MTKFSDGVARKFANREAKRGCGRRQKDRRAVGGQNKKKVEVKKRRA